MNIGLHDSGVAQKRHSLSVTQDLNSLATMVRDASNRRRLASARAYFDAIKKRRPIFVSRSQKRETA